MYSATDQPVADEYRPAKRQGSGDEEQTYETADHPGDVSSRCEQVYPASQNYQNKPTYSSSRKNVTVRLGAEISIAPPVQ
jgi:hypothetical protein